MRLYIREKIYSKAFEDGVNYAIQRLFAEEEGDQNKSGATPWIVGAAAGTAAGLGGGYLASAGNRERIQEGKTAVRLAGVDIENSDSRYKRRQEEAQNSYENGIQKAKEKHKEALDELKEDFGERETRTDARGRVHTKEGDLERINDKHEQRLNNVENDFATEKRNIESIHNKEIHEANNRRNVGQEQIKRSTRSRNIKHTIGAVAGLGVGLGAAALYKHFKNKNQQPQNNVVNS